MFPEGTNVESIPADLMTAIDHALLILNWRENAMEQDDIPPKWMWHLDWEIKEHFEQVEIRRKAKFGNNGDSSEEAEDEWEDNAYAARFN
jgi:hypothetical protein